jgi:NTP pyrophosphatase (non-canonical NTP hydrolase)
MLKPLQEKIFAINKAIGWHDKTHNVGERLMLIVSELSEALDADRIGKKANIRGFYSDLANAGIISDDETMTFYQSMEYKRSFESTMKDTFEDELADALIRLLDLAQEHGIDLDRHVQEKLRYNVIRGKIKKY